MLNASSQLRVEELETELARARSELSVTTKQLTELSAKLAKIESERDNLRRAYQPRSQSGRIPAFSMTGTRLLTLRRRIHVAKAERIDPCQLELELHETQKKLKELAAELEQQAGEGDRLLFTDQLGSTLVETDGVGQVKARFASYPFGAPRYDSSEETRAYANAPRDRAVGLDLMGARFYAPDLGFWTQGDPLAIDSPEQTVGAEFGTANPYAYVNLTPLVANDPNGEFWHVVAGAAAGALIGGGIEAARQYIQNGKVEDWGRVGAAAAGGAVSGIVQTALPGVGTAAMLTVGAASGAAGGATERLVESGGQSAGSLADVAIDAAVGAATAGVLRGASKVVRGIEVAKTPAGTAPVAKKPGGTTGVATPHGTAFQDANLASLRGDVGAGRQIFRGGTFGRSAAGEAQFFALESPLSPGFADRVGAATLGSGTLDFVIGATAKPGANFVTRHAPAFGKNAGGAPEVVVEVGGVHLDFFHMP